MKFFKHLLLTLFFLLTSVACKDSAIVHDLKERDANEILVILAKQGIKASKESVEKNQEVTWIVKVDEKDGPEARKTLVANRLPRVRHGGLSGICQDAGLILTPKTEKCREILAFKGELINSLESIPGVVSADVVLNLPDKEEFPDENTPPPRPTASVTLRVLKEASEQTKLTEGKVQEFIANGVSGLDSRDVAVIISYEDAGLYAKLTQGDFAIAEEETLADGKIPSVLEASEELTSVGGLKLESESAKKFKLIAVMFLVLFLLLTGAFLFALLRIARLKKQAVPPTPNEVPAKVEEDKKLLEA